MKHLLLMLVFTSDLGFGSILPPNDLHLEDRLRFSRSGIDEAVFDKVLDEIEVVYGPIFERHGGKLVIQRRWADPVVNAAAMKNGEKWLVIMYGGLARRPEITIDGFTLSTCHEVGHHLGGLPVFKLEKDMSVEGQADYFSVHSCAKLLWQNQADQNAKFRDDVAGDVKSICDATYFGEAEQNLCYRSVTAALSIGQMLSSVFSQDVSLATPSRDIAGRTKQWYPPIQCRLDTLVAGSLCSTPFDSLAVPATWPEVRATSCLEPEVRSTGSRPICWFKPPNSDLL